MIFWIIVIVVGFFFVRAIFDLVVDFVANIIVGYKTSSQEQPKKPATKPVQKAEKSPAPAPTKPEEIEIPASFDGYDLAYRYDDVRIFIPDELNIDFPGLVLGSRVSFRAERDNPYDSEALAVYTGETKLGYLNRGKMRDMVYDFRDRGEPILSWIKAVDDDEHIVQLLIVFYR